MEITYVAAYAIALLGVASYVTCIAVALLAYWQKCQEIRVRLQDLQK